MVSVGALAVVPVLPAYWASKAAAFSLTQSLRALLAGRGGVEVHAVLPCPIDTDMVRDSRSRRPRSKASSTASRTGRVLALDLLWLRLGCSVVSQPGLLSCL